MNCRSKLKRLGAFSLLIFLGAALSFAQLTTASLTGLVADPGGAVIPGATVILTNSDTGEERQQDTGPEGRFTLSQLKPGSYELSVSTVGFKTFLRSGIRLQANQDAEVNATLELGEVTETVEVTATAVVLDTQSANQSNSLNSEEITELPINFRNPLALVHANAGVISMFARSGRTQLQDRVSDQDYGLFSMNGGREASIRSMSTVSPTRAVTGARLSGRLRLTPSKRCRLPATLTTPNSARSPMVSSVL